MENEFIVCQKCGEQNPSTNNFCSKCSAPLKETPIIAPAPAQTDPIKQKKKGKGCLIAIGVIIVLMVLISLIGGGDKTEVKPEATDPVTSTAVGLEAASFDKAVQDAVAAINTDNVISKVETEVVGESTAFVKLYLANTDSWTGTSDLDRKEFINNVGTMMDNIAISLTKDVVTGVETQVYSPGGIKLGTRTVWGNVNIEK